MRVISHNDADGITSAGLICSALFRAGIPYQATLVPRLDENVVKGLEGPVLFCDMGSGQPDLISRVKGDVFVLDHHRPVGTLSCPNLNPHHFGIDGAFELSAAGTVYSVVRKMGQNADLAGLALVGAMGDRQALIGPNRDILDEAVKAGAVEVRAGLKMAEDGPVEEVFARTLEPLLDFVGDPQEAQEFLAEVGCQGRVEELAGTELARLSSAIVLKLLMQGSFAADSVVGEIIRLKREVLENAFELVMILNACGKMDLPGLGLSLCLRDTAGLPEARKMTLEYRKSILEGIDLLRRQHRDLQNIRYLLATEIRGGGVVAGLGIRYLFTDRPLLVLNHKEGTVRVSGRGNKPLVRAGLDLSVALRVAAENVGGVGGGHTIASGATLPPGREEEFLAHVDRIVGEQLRSGVSS
ncbi:MAG TPA: DHH family phosphoesterase [Methanotrichaceae archaeon]|nr:DHH family phosphoesterase [Methanotrichaceae archaeon]HQF17380.1 DHH family phosphoesterase [Methanotrichaceae archaeon]HQI91142.1 DHH family phosphoesterase [Methanotrichaceae archaeon]HQJ29211.1 DHH family phosphoesterase [Methanotrichaceae archaeon]